MKPFIHHFTDIARSTCKRAWGLALFLALLHGSIAQASDLACLTAGRLDASGQWAPKFDGIVLLDSAGKAISSSKKADLQAVKALQITEPALLSVCEGDRPLASGEGTPVKSKTPVPAAKPGRLAVVGIGYPQLRVGGALVEVKVQISADQTILVLR